MLEMPGKNVTIAQLDRASGYEPEGRGFESLRSRHKNPVNAGFFSLDIVDSGLYKQ